MKYRKWVMIGGKKMGDGEKIYNFIKKMENSVFDPVPEPDKV